MNKPVYIHFSNGSHFAYDGGFDNFIKELDICKRRNHQFLKLKLRMGWDEDIFEPKDIVIQIQNILYFYEESLN